MPRWMTVLSTETGIVSTFLNFNNNCTIDPSAQGATTGIESGQCIQFNATGTTGKENKTIN